ncbi:MAG: hypothetical protein Q4A88_03565 [Clostridia bacterium]|nr:hypothetical protein [Clostridia bacterium]
MQIIKDFLDRNKWAIVFVLATILMVAMFVWLRWWAFLVIPGLALAVYLGHLMDKGGIDSLKDFFGSLFSKRN